MKSFILIVGLIVSSLFIHAQTPGSLDLSFGSGGKTLFDYNNTSNTGECIAILPDGGFVVCANNGYWPEQNCLLLKYLSNGSPDLTFGTMGMVKFGFGVEESYCYDVAVRADGKILVAGMSRDASNTSIGMARFTPDGQPDLTFGYAGAIIVNLGNSEYATSILLLSDNKFLICGVTEITTGHYDLLLVKFFSNGSVDQSFGTNGVTITDLHSGSNDMARGMVFHNNKILISACAYGPLYNSYDAVVLARYTTTGALDPSFGAGGLSVIDGLKISDMLLSIDTRLVVDQQNRIVVSGVYIGVDEGENGMLLRFLPNGYPDNSFGDGGLKVYDLDGETWFQGLAIQADGKILAAGLHKDGTNYNTFLLRATEDGSPDPTFGLENGFTIIDLSNGGSGFDVALDMTLQNNNKVLLTGSVATQSNKEDIVVSRFHLGTTTHSGNINLPDFISACFDPAGNCLMINNLRSGSRIGLCTLSDMTGKIIQQWKDVLIQEADFRLKLNSNLSAGIYILSINDGAQIQSVKMEINPFRSL